MMKFFTVLLIVVVLASFAFAFNFQVGGGVEVADFWTSGVALPTINTSFAFPISNNLSVTGQIGSVLTQQMNYITTLPSTQSAALLALIGVRYTTKPASSDISGFVGFDAGFMSNFVSSNAGFSPIIGVNGGYIFPIVSGFEGYVKGALRFMMATVPTSGQIGNTFPLSLPIVEISTGLNFSF
ncbi:hypothetical protein [Athalassotoga sp.]|uniref:hypothetical protein n=1 Tax=Athalassotoga sp. TaxID=2022597 RepID=UPI003D04DC10